MIERVLLVVNREAAGGRSTGETERIAAALAEACGPGIDVTFRLVDGHPAVTRVVGEFLSVAPGPSLVVAGGGGGTVRAAIEAPCAQSPAGNLPGEERLQFAALRLGSGNVLAKELGMPKSPDEAARAIGVALRAGRTAPVTVVRCEFSPPGRGPQIALAVTLGGFGQLGAIPGDIGRWRRRLRPLHRAAAAAVGIERITPLEYALTLAIRSLWCAAHPAAAETVDVRGQGGTTRLRLLAGALMTFRMSSLPLDPGVRLGEGAFCLHLVPLRNRGSALALALRPGWVARTALRVRVGGGEAVEVSLVDRSDARFFLDEDPLEFSGRLRLTVAGTLAFIPGPGRCAAVGEGRRG
jgi:hypothetical protein